ncbi:MAG TPA: monovalent cation/H+ antiporter complex subunit F [Acidimicrobiales bacterium]|nr:monovalent cation/H+ antiporter complex subunit F [Acidimicrobiales bacterium]
MFTELAVVAQILLGIAGALAVLRVIMTSSIADRIIALDLLVVVVVLTIAIDSARSDTAAFLDVVVVVSLLGFVATSAVARFIERRGAR